MFLLAFTIASNIHQDASAAVINCFQQHDSISLNHRDFFVNDEDADHILLKDFVIFHTSGDE